MDIILLVIFGYALYRMATGHNITPWKWIAWYIASFFISIFGVVLVIFGMYGQALMKDMDALAKIVMPLQPFVLLYQFLLFFIFRSRMLRYVHQLDQIDKNDNNQHTPGPPKPQKDAGEQKDFSYFR